MKKISQDKFTAALLGVMFGDSFGSRYEFLTSEESSNKINQDYQDHHDYLILGGGPFDIQPGQLTDDSEMMISLLNAICDDKNYNQEHVALNYIKWYNTNPVDIGNTVKKSLHTRRRASNHLDMIQNSKDMNSSSLSNGSMMRIMPIALFCVNKTDKILKKLVKQECILTHPNKIIRDFTYIYCLAVKYSILEYKKEDIYNILLENSKNPRVIITLQDALDTSEPTYIVKGRGLEDYINTDNTSYFGYIGIAFQNALYALLHFDNITDALVYICKKGGDTDTNACIACGLLGAYYGSSTFNKQWKQVMLNGGVDRYERYEFLDPKRVITDTSILLYNLII